VATGRYGSAELVALNNGIRCEGMFAVIDMNVTPAHSNAMNLQKNFTRTGFWFRNFRILDYPGRGHHCASHLGGLFKVAVEMGRSFRSKK